MIALQVVAFAGSCLCFGTLDIILNDYSRLYYMLILYSEAILGDKNPMFQIRNFRLSFHFQLFRHLRHFRRSLRFYYFSRFLSFFHLSISVFFRISLILFSLITFVPNANAFDLNAITQFLQKQVNESVLDSYNQTFRTHFTHEAAMRLDMESRLKQYFAAIRNCQPGIYHLAFSVPLANSILFFTKSTILGIKNNQCIIESTHPQVPAENYKIACRLSTQHLPLFTEEEALKLFTPFTMDLKNLTDFQKAVSQECRVTMTAETFGDVFRLYYNKPALPWQK